MKSVIYYDTNCYNCHGKLNAPVPVSHPELIASTLCVPCESEKTACNDRVNSYENYDDYAI